MEFQLLKLIVMVGTLSLSWAQQPTVTVPFSPLLLSDGCPKNSTFIPSPSGDPDLIIELEWPETDIGQTQKLKCPCGPANFSIGVVREATRRCWGTFQEVAVWDDPMAASCNFSDTARQLCKLAFVRKEEGGSEERKEGGEKEGGGKREGGKEGGRERRGRGESERR